jgi:hypothetical protein
MLFVNTGYTNAMAGNVLLAFSLVEGAQNHNHGQTALPTNQSSRQSALTKLSRIKGEPLP